MSLEDSISGLDLDIEEATLAVTKVNAKIITIKREVSQNKKNIEELREKIKDNRELLLKYLVYVYKKTNNVSE
jgi:peptidoglycan hydrolase CwlO-like protein